MTPPPPLLRRCKIVPNKNCNDSTILTYNLPKPSILHLTNPNCIALPIGCMHVDILKFCSIFQSKVKTHMRQCNTDFLTSGLKDSDSDSDSDSAERAPAEVPAPVEAPVTAEAPGRAPEEEPEHSTMME